MRLELVNRTPNKWQCSIIVTCLRMYHVTSILHFHWSEFWSRDTGVYLTYVRFGIILTVLCQFLEIGIVQLLFSGFSQYLLSFSFTVPLIFRETVKKRKLYQSKIIGTEDVISTVHPWNEWNVQFATVSFKIVTMKERYPLN